MTDQTKTPTPENPQPPKAPSPQTQLMFTMLSVFITNNMDVAFAQFKQQVNEPNERAMDEAKQLLVKGQQLIDQQKIEPLLERMWLLPPASWAQALRDA